MLSSDPFISTNGWCFDHITVLYVKKKADVAALKSILNNGSEYLDC
jgi:hypothetical protein